MIDSNSTVVFIYMHTCMLYVSQVHNKYKRKTVMNGYNIV